MTVSRPSLHSSAHRLLFQLLGGGLLQALLGPAVPLEVIDNASDHVAQKAGHAPHGKCLSGRENWREMLTRTLLACGVVGGSAFLAVALAAGALRQDYSALHQPVSLLSLGHGGWVQIANFVVTGLLMVACGAGLRRALGSGRGATWGPLLIAAYGIGLIGAGVFSADPSFGYPPGAALGRAASLSVPGLMHELTSVIVFASLTAACFVFARRFASEVDGRGWVAYSFATGLAVPGFLIAAFTAWSSGSPVNFGGVFQRATLVAGWTWVVLLALRTIRETR